MQEMKAGSLVHLEELENEFTKNGPLNRPKYKKWNGRLSLKSWATASAKTGPVFGRRPGQRRWKLLLRKKRGPNNPST